MPGREHEQHPDHAPGDERDRRRLRREERVAASAGVHRRAGARSAARGRRSTPRHRPSVGSRNASASADPAERRRVERHGDVAEHARRTSRGRTATTVIAPAAIAGSRVPSVERERQHGDRLEREEADGDERLRRHVAADERDDADREQPGERPRTRATTTDSPSQRPTSSSARRSGRASIAWTVPVSTSDAIAGAAEERGRHREHEAEHERDEDQDLADADPDARPRRLALLAGDGHQPLGPQPDEHDARRSTGRASTQRTRRRAISRSVRPAIDERRRALTLRLRARLVARTRSRNRSSSERRPGSTAWTRPPAATTAATSVRDAVRSRRRTISQPSPSRSTGPNASSGRAVRRQARRPAAGRAVSPEQVRQRAGRDDPAVVDDRDPVAQPLDLAQEVRVEEDGRAARLRLADDGADVVAAHRIERGRGLVEDDERRVAEQRGAEAEALLHALREAARSRSSARPSRPTSASTRSISAGAAPRRARRAGAWSPSTSRARQPRLVAEQLREVADPTARREVAERRAEDRAARRRSAG